MFEGILERVLQRALGDYLEGLDKKNLSLGVWSGNINLENVYVKRSIFDKLKLPLILKLGRIGKLQISVPWRRLSSAPVEVVISGVNIIICKNGLADSQYVGPKKAEHQEQGFFKNLVTKILDNVQVTIQNIHLRMESYENPNNRFSLGITLKEITVHTTNQNWEKEFFDRTKDQNQEKPVFKVLNIVKFGLYWKTKEEKFISEEHENEEDRLSEMRAIYTQDDDIIEQYKSFYLLQPIILSMKLKQIISAQMLEREAEYQISLDVDEFSIYLQKTQYDNLVNLMQLFNDYSNFQDQYQQTRKYNFLRPINDNDQHMPLAMLQFASQCIRREIRQQKTKKNQFQIESDQKQQMKQQFISLYKDRLVAEINRQELIEKQQNASMIPTKFENIKTQRLYEYITMSCDIEELKEWAIAVAQQAAEEQEEKDRIQQSNPQGGLFRYFTKIGASWIGLGGNGENDDTIIEQQPVLNQRQEDEDDEFYDAFDELPVSEKKNLNQRERKTSFEEELHMLRQSLLTNFTPQALAQMDNQATTEQQKSLINLIRGNMLSNDEQQQRYRNEMRAKCIPVVQGKFVLKHFSIAFVNNIESNDGIEIYSHDFIIDLMKYDETKSMNIYSFEIIAKNKEFGINQLYQKGEEILKAPIVSKFHEASEINQTDTTYQSIIKLLKGNSNQVLSQDIILDQDIDFDLFIQFQPIQIIYQVESFQNLSKFFRVKNLINEDIKQQAYEKMEALKQQVNLTDVLKNKKKNRLRIEIASPILIIPFKAKRNSANYECWIFNMGNLFIQNHEIKHTNPETLLKMRHFDRYKIQNSQIMMKYQKFEKNQNEHEFWKYCALKSEIQVIKEFKLSLILQVRKETDQYNKDEAEFIISGKMSELLIYFTPYLYNQFLNVSMLLSADEPDKESQESLFINEKSQVIKSASKIGLVKKRGNAIKFWYSYFGVLSGSYIYFYDQQNDNYPSDYFFVKGAQLFKNSEKDIDYSLLIVNFYGEQCSIALNSQKSQDEWEKAVKEKVFEITSVDQIQQEQRVSLPDPVQNSIDLEKKLMRFSFEIPLIEIELTAQKSNKDFNNNSEDAYLVTEMQQNDEFDIGIFTQSKIRNSIMKGNHFQNSKKHDENNPFDQAQDDEEESKDKAEDNNKEEEQWMTKI